MLRAVFGLTIIMTSFVMSMPALATPFGTREEALAMVRRVQEMFKRDGAAATFKAVTAKAKPFHDRDLYPFIYDMNGVVLAHGLKAELVGKNLIDFKDQDGKFLVRKEIEVVQGPGSGWVDIRFLNPVTNQVEAKSSYVERMGPYWVGVGVYLDEQPNENTVGIVSGSPNSDDTYLQTAYDLAAVLNDRNRLRILPMAGIGGPQNIRDVRNLKGIDIGITQTNILNSFRRSNEQLGVSDDKIVYISKLFSEEAHLVARADISSVEQLQGQKVNLDEVGSGSSYSMRDIFKRLGIKVEEVNMTEIDAFEKLKSGEIAATVLIAGKPAYSMSKLKSTDGLHLLPLPFSSALINDYLPTTLEHDDYPEMIPPGQSVDTIAVTAVLIAYNWPKNTDRYRRVKTFVEEFFPRIAEFQKPPRHVKWREVNLAAKLTGWNRFEPAETWLENDRIADSRDAQSAVDHPTSRENANVLPAREQALFQEFLRWKRSGQQAQHRP
jgi:TRAP-type uncharacterized transport system substrate-binding protein